MVIVATVKVVVDTTMKIATIIMRMVVAADIAINKVKRLKIKKVKGEYVRADIQTDHIWRESW